MERLTKKDYRNIVHGLGVLKWLTLNQHFPSDMEEKLRKQTQEHVINRSAEIQSLIDKVCRIHLD